MLFWAALGLLLFAAVTTDLSYHAFLDRDHPDRCIPITSSLHDIVLMLTFVEFCTGCLLRPKPPARFLVLFWLPALHFSLAFIKFDVSFCWLPVGAIVLTCIALHKDLAGSLRLLAAIFCVACLVLYSVAVVPELSNANHSSIWTHWKDPRLGQLYDQYPLRHDELRAIGLWAFPLVCALLYLLYACLRCEFCVLRGRCSG